MRFHHLLVSLAVIFITIIAVEGLPQSASPTPPLSSGSRIAGEEATRKEKGLVDLWIVGEGFAGQSDRDPYEQLAGCRSRQDEEAKK
jgi:hypothetical protein